MSGVYIKGMQMPTGCKDCDLVLDLRASMLCPISGEFVDFEDTPETVDCPLIPVPDHGRLVDADALLDAWDDRHTIPSKAAKVIEKTVIPADEEGES